MEPKEQLNTIRLYYCHRLKASLSILTCKNNREKPEVSFFTAETNRPLRPSACEGCTDWLQWEKQSPVAEIPIVTEKVPPSSKTVKFLSFTSVKDSEFSVKPSLNHLNFEESFNVSIESIADDSLNNIDFSKISSKKDRGENFENRLSPNGKTKGKQRKKEQEQGSIQPVEKKKRGRKSKAEKETALRMEKMSHLLFSLENILLLKEEIGKETSNILETLDTSMKKTVTEEVTVPFDIFDNTCTGHPFVEIEKKTEVDIKEEACFISDMNGEIDFSGHEAFSGQTERTERTEKNIYEAVSLDSFKILVHANSFNAFELKEYLIQKYPSAEIVCPLTDFNFQNGLAEKQFQSVIKTLETSWATHVIGVHSVEINLSLKEKEKPKKILFYIPVNTTLKF